MHIFKNDAHGVKKVAFLIRITRIFVPAQSACTNYANWDFEAGFVEGLPRIAFSDVANGLRGCRDGGLKGRKPIAGVRSLQRHPGIRGEASPAAHFGPGLE